MTERGVRELKALDQIVRELHGRPYDYSVYDNFVQAVLPDVLDLNKAHIFLFDGKGETEKEYIFGFTQKDLVKLNSRGIIRQTREDLLKQGHVVIVNDTQNDPRAVPELAIKLDVGSYANVIFKEEGEVYGYLHMCRSLDKIRRGEARRFGEENKLFLDIVGRTIAIALKNKKMYEELNYMATIDNLTKLPNMMTFYKTLDQRIKGSKSGEKLSVAMSDIDNFKRFVDTYGHPEGSKLVYNLAQLFRLSIRDEYTVSNYAGDEFIFIMPRTAQDEAKQITEMLGKKVAGHPFEAINPASGRTDLYSLTCSFGVAEAYGITESLADNAVRIIAERAVNMADRAVFEAKQLGRNKSVIYSEKK